MSEELKTIKELADELGVSKQAIRKYFDKLPNDLIPKKERGAYLLNQDIQKFIKNKVNPVDSAVDTSKQSVDSAVDTSKQSVDSAVDTSKQSVDSAVDSIKNEIILDKNIQIEYLKAKIDNLMEAQKQTQNLLDQQQRLALQDKKLLEEYKAEINDLKALKMPSEDAKEEQAGNQPLEELEALKNEIKVLNDKIKGQEQLNNQSSKKWWKFWK